MVKSSTAPEVFYKTAVLRKIGNIKVARVVNIKFFFMD